MILTLWLHSWTDKALLVSPSFISHTAERKGAWLPLSQIKQLKRETVELKTKTLKTQVTLDIPQWLIDKNKQLLAEDRDS